MSSGDEKSFDQIFKAVKLVFRESNDTGQTSLFNASSILACLVFGIATVILRPNYVIPVAAALLTFAIAAFVELRYFSGHRHGQMIFGKTVPIIHQILILIILLAIAALSGFIPLVIFFILLSIKSLFYPIDFLRDTGNYLIFSLLISGVAAYYSLRYLPQRLLG